jgi:hypothetical protein
MSTRWDDASLHVAELADGLGVTIGPQSKGGRAFPRERHIAIRPVRSSVTYAIGLHELGHIATGKTYRLAWEGLAWQWAIDQAREEYWTMAAHKAMVRSLQSYYHWAEWKHSRNVANAPRLPPVGHPFWTLTGRTPMVAEPNLIRV